MAETDADVQKIKELIEIMKENDLVKIDVKHGDDRISLWRAEPPRPPSVGGPITTSLPGAALSLGAPGGDSSPGQAPPAKAEEGLLEIRSPIVGTFYEGPSPDSDPYVELGSHVDPQTVVCIIEAMKVMNEIKAEISGAVVEKHVNNGQAVEYGQVLFRVRSD